MQASETPQQKYLRTEAVESLYFIGGPPQDEQNMWEDLLDILRGGVWLDIEIVLSALEHELNLLREGTGQRDTRKRASCLAKLRLAMIYGQIQSAPEINRNDPDTALWEWVNETAPVFPLFSAPGRTLVDLAVLLEYEFDYIRDTIIPEIVRKTKALKRDAIEMAVARLATPYRQIRRAKPNVRRLFVSSVLVPKNTPANGRPLADEVLRDMYPMFQNFGKRRSREHSRDTVEQSSDIQSA